MRRVKSVKFKIILAVVLLLAGACSALLFLQRWCVLVKEETGGKAMHYVEQIENERKNINKETEELLKKISSLPSAHKLDQAECSQEMAGLLRLNTRYTNLGIINLKGDLICSGLVFSRPIDGAERLYFKKTLETEKFSVGDYQLGKITNKPTLGFGYPVFDDNNKLTAVAFASLDLNWLNLYFADLDAPNGAILLETDDSNLILMRYPEPEKWVGRYLSDMNLLQAAFIHGQGTYQNTAPDNVERIYAYAPVRSDNADSRAYINVGLSKKYLAWQWSRLRDGYLIFLILFNIIFISLLVVLIYQIIKQLLKKRGDEVKKQS